MPVNPCFLARFIVQKNRRNIGFLLAALLIISLFIGAFPQTAQAKENPKYASIIMDADTGLILHQSSADKKLHPASLTKVMTLLMVFEAIDQGRLNLNDRMKVSKYASGMAPSKLDLKAGSTIKVKDGIYALVTKSANDVAAVFAEHLGGTESGFARLMTARARELGMTSTTFKNASGLHNPAQVSSARDMAKLARYVITQHPDQYRYFSTSNFSYQGRSYHNHNRLMETYKGMDGMKTGYIAPSGFNLVASAVRGNHRLIGVVFGGRTTASRNAHMATLLDKGFAKVGDVLMANADVAPAPIQGRMTAQPQNLIPVQTPIASVQPPVRQMAAYAPANVPIPPRKPGILVAMNTLNNTAPAAGMKPMAALQAFAPVPTTPVIKPEPLLEQDKFSEIIGEGDSDPAAAHRIETGLMAIAAHTHENAPALTAPSASDSWAIQIGAFTSRAATDRALNTALKKLPEKYAGVNPVIAPLKTNAGWLFRARLSGYTKAQAFGACGYVKDCLPVAPQNN